MAIEQEGVGIQKRLVLDANILLRAVFGIRVRSLLEAYESRVAFYTPDVCFDDARKYIPDLAVRRKFDPTAGLLVLSSSLNWSMRSTLVCTSRTKNSPELVSHLAMQTTGQSSPLPCFWIVRSGPKTRISSAAASRHGLQTESSFTCAAIRSGFSNQSATRAQMQSLNCRSCGASRSP
jgi:hypothetical protein